jgi:hypothetical protein
MTPERPDFSALPPRVALESTAWEARAALGRSHDTPRETALLP